MERKDYLKERLSKEEKAYLKRIIMTARNIFFRKNYNHIYNTTMLVNDEIIAEEESVLGTVLNRCQEEIVSAVEFENAMSDPKLYKIVKALSLKEKEVLFYLYKEQKTVNEIAQIMKIDRITVWRIRNRAQSKIAKEIIKGDDLNV